MSPDRGKTPKRKVREFPQYLLHFKNQNNINLGS